MNTNNEQKCGHTILQHKQMEEAKASSELEGARTDKSICELIDMAGGNNEQKKCEACKGVGEVTEISGNSPESYEEKNVPCTDCQSFIVEKKTHVHIHKRMVYEKTFLKRGELI